MADLYFSEEGDVALSHTGDLAMTDDPWRDDLQQAYIRLMTDQEDYLLYPLLGASLSELYGMPQSPATGTYGKELITAALTRESRFDFIPFIVDAVPTGPQTIRFDLSIISASSEKVFLSVEADLGLGG